MVYGFSSFRMISDFQSPFDLRLTKPAFPPPDMFGQIYDNTGSVATFAVDIKETPTSFEIKADMPGVKKDEVRVSIHDKVLLISAERLREEVSKGEKYARAERFSGIFTRSMRLPDNANEDDVEAKFDHGVLVLKVAKIPGKVVIEKKVVEIK